jgi:hypothetical protein
VPRRTGARSTLDLPYRSARQGVPGRREPVVRPATSRCTVAVLVKAWAAGVRGGDQRDTLPGRDLKILNSEFRFLARDATWDEVHSLLAIDGDREPAGGGLGKSTYLAQVRTLLHPRLVVQSTACIVLYSTCTYARSFARFSCTVRAGRAARARAHDGCKDEDESSLQMLPAGQPAHGALRVLIGNANTPSLPLLSHGQACQQRQCPTVMPCLASPAPAAAPRQPARLHTAGPSAPVHATSLCAICPSFHHLWDTTHHTFTTFHLLARCTRTYLLPSTAGASARARHPPGLRAGGRQAVSCSRARPALSLRLPDCWRRAASHRTKLGPVVRACVRQMHS